jgi:hypothetical protein
MSKLPLLSRTVTLLSAYDPHATHDIDARTKYSFSIPFPTYIDGQEAPLPPSHTAFHPGVSTEIEYALQVDITRKGLFRRNEV